MPRAAARAVAGDVRRDAYYAEIAGMLRNMPRDWHRQYRSGRDKLAFAGGPVLPDKPTPEQAMGLIGITAGGNPSGDTPWGPHKVPKAVREAAMHGIRLSYEHNYGAWDFIGLARAIELVIVPSVSETTYSRMGRYLFRHKKDARAAGFGDDENPSRGYMAWLNWGGNPAVEWTRAFEKNPRKETYLEGVERREKRKGKAERTFDTAQTVGSAALLGAKLGGRAIPVVGEVLMVAGAGKEAYKVGKRRLKGGGGSWKTDVKKIGAGAFGLESFVPEGVPEGVPEAKKNPSNAFGPRKPLFGPYTYRVKQNSNGDTLIGVYFGSKRIAHMDAYWAYSMRSIEDREEEVKQRGRGRSCATDLRALGAEGKYPNVLAVSHAFITDDEHKGKGVGRAMYEAMMVEGFAVRQSRIGGQPGPMFFIPDECSGAGNTSAEARRVWASLVRDYPSQGTSIRVDAPPVIGSRKRTNPESGAEKFARLKVFADDLRDYFSAGGACSVLGSCGDAAYWAFDFLRKTLPDVQIVYGELAWPGHEPIAHWWVASERAGLLVDAANPYVREGVVVPTADARYRATRHKVLTRKELRELQEEYESRDLDPDYYRSMLRGNPRRRNPRRPAFPTESIPSGTLLYHGTNTEDAFEVGGGVPSGPAWFSNNKDAARFFAREWREGEGRGKHARVLIYAVTQSIPKVATVRSKRDFDALLARLGLDPSRVEASHDMTEMRDAMARQSEFGGWNIHDNYQPGDDVLLVSPEKYLRLLRVERANPRRSTTTAERTDPALWEAVKREVTAGSKGGRPGQWSARKAQLAVALYKQRGGDYWGAKSPRNALVKWTREDWRTRSGKPSLVTGERYLPARAIEALSPAEYAATSRAKREGMRRGEQFTRQPERIAAKTARYRRNPSRREADAMRVIRANLTPDLLAGQYRACATEHPMAGHCAVATEALYFMLGGKEAGYTPMNVRHEGVSHWYLRTPEGDYLDPTADQFDTPVDYAAGRGRGFPTPKQGRREQPPSKRAETLLRRVTRR